MRIEFDNVHARILDATDNEKRTLRLYYRTFAPGYRFNKLYKQKKWDGKVSVLDTKEWKLPAGFVPELCSRFPRAEFVDQRPTVPAKFHRSPISLRPYQHEVVVSCLQNKVAGTWWPRGVIQACTGSGKTRMAASLIDMSWHLKTLFLVHREQLGAQAKQEFTNLGVRDQNTTIMTIQSLMSWAYKLTPPEKKRDETDEEFEDRCYTYMERLERQNDKGSVQREFLSSIEQVIVDEAHLVAASIDQGNLFTKALALMPNATIRWGLTGTPFMREEFHDWMLEGSVGPALCRIKTIDLINQGYLPRPDIRLIHTPKLNLPVNTWPACYEAGIVHNDRRNKRIVDLMASEQGPILVFFLRKEHGQILYSLAQQKGISVTYVDGDSSLTERKKAASDMETGRKKVTLASTVWDEGINIPAINTMILAGGYKAPTKMIQRLGRILRGTGSVTVYDFVDTSAPSLKRHSSARQKIWLTEGHQIKFIS